jgi:hypothetical protein
LNSLNKGLKYNTWIQPKNWLTTLAMEAEIAVRLLPIQEQDSFRWRVAENIIIIKGKIS